MTNEVNEMSAASRLVACFAANIAGLLCVIWPVLPKQWGAWELVGRLFGASKDPGMGIQYMFIWLATIPLGWLLSYLGTKTATGSGGLACMVALALVGGAVYAMVLLEGNR
jgi:hypothetical protein